MAEQRNPDIRVNNIDERDSACNSDSYRSPKISSAFPNDPTIFPNIVGSECSQRHCRLWSIRSMRLQIAVALALAFTIEGLMRSNINMAMVCMVNQTALSYLPSSDYKNLSSKKASISILHQDKIKIKDDVNCYNDSFLRSNSTIAKRSYNGDLVIPKSKQSIIFTSFYIGGLAVIPITNCLCNKFGVKYLVSFGALVNTVGTFSTPFIARFSSEALIVVRFLMGCGQGILMPCMHVLVACWFPLNEKSTAIAIATTGNQVAVVVALFLTAELCLLDWLGGWPWAFYPYGVLGAMFCVVWWILVADTPADARSIRQHELEYIYSLDEHTLHTNISSSNNNRHYSTPWKKILCSPAVWAIGACSFSQNFMIVGTVVYLPLYYSSILKLNLSSNGLMSAFPFLIQLITKIAFAAFADEFRRRSLMSFTGVTKLCNFIGSVGAGVFFIFLSFCDCSRPYLAISCIVAAVGISSGFIPGYNTSVVVIAPRYTAAVAAHSRLLGQIASVLSPWMIGFLTSKNHGFLLINKICTPFFRRYAFWVMAVVLITTGTFFQFFGSASIQDWALSDQNSVHFAASTKLKKPLIKQQNDVITENVENNNNRVKIIETDKFSLSDKAKN